MTDKTNESDIKYKGTSLESEIKDFEQERENVRRIIGQIGGVPSGRSKIINFIFIIMVVAVFAMSIIYGGRMRFFMMEIGIFLLSLKLIYFLESYMRLNHFQFWILSSLEWRMDKIDKAVKELSKSIEKK